MGSTSLLCAMPCLLPFRTLKVVPYHTLLQDSALSYSDEDVAAQREAWNRELELREASTPPQ